MAEKCEHGHFERRLCCSCLEAQVARLEDADGRLAAALREEQSHWRAALTAWQGNETIDIDYSSGLAAEARLTAALSDAGEG